MGAVVDGIRMNGVANGMRINALHASGNPPVSTWEHIIGQHQEAQVHDSRQYNMRAMGSRDARREGS